MSPDLEQRATVELERLQSRFAYLERKAKRLGTDAAHEQALEEQLRLLGYGVLLDRALHADAVPPELHPTTHKSLRGAYEVLEEIRREGLTT